MEEQLNNAIWVTGDGRGIKVEDLEDEHLRNIYQWLLIKKISAIYRHKYKKFMPLVLQEIEYRGMGMLKCQDRR